MPGAPLSPSRAARPSPAFGCGPPAPQPVPSASPTQVCHRCDHFGACWVLTHLFRGHWSSSVHCIGVTMPLFSPHRLTLLQPEVPAVPPLPALQRPMQMRIVVWNRPDFAPRYSMVSHSGLPAFQSTSLAVHCSFVCCVWTEPADGGLESAAGSAAHPSPGDKKIP